MFRALYLLVGLAGVATVGWGALALAFSGPGGPAGRGALVVGCLLAGGWLLLRVRPRRRGWLAFAGLFAVLLGWWLLIPPRNDRDWQPNVAVLPWAEIAGDVITVHNVRNNVYRSETDYDARYEHRVYRLSALRSLDGERQIAPIVEAEAHDGVCDVGRAPVDEEEVEGRMEKGEAYSVIEGFFKQYELTFVVADERDVIGLRTDFRGENVHLYRFRTPPEAARRLFLRYLAEANRLRDHPEWYNALTHNCTTTIRGLAAPEAQHAWRSWKFF